MPFRPTVVFVAIGSIVVCGCSAGIINEDGPGWSLADKPPTVRSELRNGFSAADLEAGLPSQSSTGSRALAGAAAAAQGQIQPRTGIPVAGVPVAGVSATSVPVVRKVKATTEPARPAAAARPTTTVPATVAPSVGSATAAATSNAAIAVVVKGDTLHGLSLKHRVSVKAIMSANNLTNTTIFLGQKLVIPDAPR